VSVFNLTEIVETSLLKRIFTKKQDDGSIDLGEFHAEETRTLLSEALYELYRTMTAIAGALYEVFSGLSKELDFFTTSVKYCDYLKSNDMSYSFPTAGDTGFSAVNLYDPLLLVEGLTKDAIVTNTLTASASSGVLIRGANVAGKTSLIRAVGLCHLFALSGLPVCADSAEVRYSDAVFAQFSKSEQLGKLDEAGRFEQEVRELAEIYDALRGYKHPLVLLNETFQTTSYSEGADAIRHILAAMRRRNADWFFVTHLTPLLTDPPGGSVTLTMKEFALS
jgi:DNA mismatch repair ATPase MutS